MSRNVAVAALLTLALTGCAAEPSAPPEPSPQATAAVAPIPAGATMVVYGDSYTAGVSAGGPTTAFPHPLADELGWTVAATHASVGGGYAADGTDGTAADLIAAHPAATPGVVLLQFGINDRIQPPDRVAAGQRAALAAIRAQAPQATIVVVGMLWRGATNPNIDAVAEAIRTTALATPNTAYVDPWTAPKWTYELHPEDRAHPSEKGHREIAAAIAAALREAGLV